MTQPSRQCRSCHWIQAPLQSHMLALSPANAHNQCQTTHASFTDEDKSTGFPNQNAWLEQLTAKYLSVTLGQVLHHSLFRSPNVLFKESDYLRACCCDKHLGVSNNLLFFSVANLQPQHYAIQLSACTWLNTVFCTELRICTGL